MDIPKNKDVSEDTEFILKLLRKKYNLKEDRLKVVTQARELRTKIYNFTLEIERLEKQIDKILIERLK